MQGDEFEQKKMCADAHGLKNGPKMQLREF
jgi:hypothetical protein